MASRLPRIARRLARFWHLHRLHRARRIRDRRRRLGGGEPCRRHRQRRAVDSRRRCFLCAHSARSQRRRAQLLQQPRHRLRRRHDARDGAHQRRPLEPRRDQSRRCRLSAVRFGRDQSDYAASGFIRTKGRRVRRRRRSGAADAARSENRRPHHHRQYRNRAARRADRRAGQACRRPWPRAAPPHQRGRVARHRAVAARQPGALAIPAAAAADR